MTRENALKELRQPLYNEKDLREDKIYIQKKLNLSAEEFDQLLNAPIREATEFSSDNHKYLMLKRMQLVIEKLLKRGIGNYS